MIRSIGIALLCLASCTPHPQPKPVNNFKRSVLPQIGPKPVSEKHFRELHPPLFPIFSVESVGGNKPWIELRTGEARWVAESGQSSLRRPLQRFYYNFNPDGSLFTLIQDPAQQSYVVRLLNPNGHLVHDAPVEGQPCEYNCRVVPTHPGGVVRVTTTARTYVMHGKSGNIINTLSRAGDETWLSPDGSRLVTDSNSGRVSLFNTADESLVREIEFPVDYDGDGRWESGGAVFTRDGSAFYVNYMGPAGVFDTNTGARKPLPWTITLFDETSPFSDDSQGVWLISGKRGREKLELRSLQGGQLLAQVALPKLSCESRSCPYRSAGFRVARPRGPRGFLAIADGKLLEVDAETKTAKVDSLPESQSKIIAVSPDERTLLAKNGSLTELVLRQESLGKSPRLPLSLHKYHQFSLDGSKVYGWTASNYAIWSAKDGQRLYSHDDYTQLRDFDDKTVTQTSDLKKWFTDPRLYATLARVTLNHSLEELGNRAYASRDLVVFLSSNSLLDLATLQSQARLSPDSYSYAAFSLDGNSLAAANSTHIDVFDVPTRQRTHRFDSTGKSSARLALSSETATLWSVYAERNVRHEVSSIQLERRDLRNSQGQPIAIACDVAIAIDDLRLVLSQNGRGIVAYAPKGFCVIDTTSAKAPTSVKLDQPGCVQVVGNEVLVGSYALNPVLRYSAMDGTSLPSLPPARARRTPDTELLGDSRYTSDPTCEFPIEILRDGTLVVASEKNQVLFVDGKLGKIFRRIQIPGTAPVTDLAVSPLGHLATIDEAGTVRIQDHAGRLVDVFEREGQKVFFSDDGTRLITLRTNKTRPLDDSPRFQLRQLR